MNVTDVEVSENKDTAAITLILYTEYGPKVLYITEEVQTIMQRNWNERSRV